MEWTEKHDRYLCDEILILEPFRCKKGSPARGQIWEKIASNLNELQLPQFKVTTRAVRERYTLICEKFKTKMRREQRASGIEVPELSEVEKPLEEILEKELVAQDSQENDKQKKDKAKAEEFRRRTLETVEATGKKTTILHQRKRTEVVEVVVY